MRSLLTIVLVAGVTLIGVSQQIPDTVYQPVIKKASYNKNAGPIVLIDEAHHNFHTADGRFKPFSLLLQRDGYQVRRGQEQFSQKLLKNVDILVISNALHERNVSDWSLPNPSAFTDQEMEVVTNWVSQGGSLFLIADHMPFPGCSEKLASAFGFTFYNGFAIDTTRQGGPDLFSSANKRLVKSSLTDGLDSIYSFTGQAFDISSEAVPLLVLDNNFKIWSPRVAWRFATETTKIEANKKVQIATLEYGKGRVVVSGEAAMFTAQLAGGTNRVGFNHPLAKHNASFLLNLIHWLDN